jgi:hypothetical protein
MYSMDIVALQISLCVMGPDAFFSLVMHRFVLDTWMDDAYKVCLIPHGFQLTYFSPSPINYPIL